MAEIEWKSIAPYLLSLLEKCEQGLEEAKYANVFNGVELALSVIRFIADSADELQPLFVKFLFAYLIFITSESDNC